MKKRLSKALAAAGVASRRACEELIFEGRVAVNGQTILKPQTLVSWEEDHITVNQKQIIGEQEKIYYILNKPVGFICTNRREGDKKIVLDLFPKHTQRLFTIGRLDRDTSGLLLVTNDGHFAHKVIHPSFNLTKEYLVKTQQEIGPEHLQEISKGARIEGTWVKPVRVSKVRKGTLKIVVKEGKKREVRLFVENAGLKILELTRIRIGGLILGPLPPGTWKEMSQKEKNAIFR